MKRNDETQNLMSHSTFVILLLFDIFFSAPLRLRGS